MDDIVQFDFPTDSPKIIKVIGVGGGGGNAVNHMYREGIHDVTFVLCNTDNQALKDSPVPVKLQLGKEGLGAGNRPARARKAAEESIEDIKNMLNDGTKMVFITAGMGGGTGTGAIIALIGLAVFMLIRSQVMYKKRKEKEKGNATIKQLMQSTDNMEILELLRRHTREELCKILEFTEDNFERTVTAFLHENLRGLRRAMGAVKFEKQLIKQMKRTGTLAMCRLDNKTVLEKGLYYYQGNDFASELIYSVGRLCEPCLEHIDNNFKPLDAVQKGEFAGRWAKCR